MPQQGITFNGAYIGLPGAYYADNVSAVAPNTPPTTPPLIFLGYGYGPKPQTPVTFTNPQDLLNALRGAPAAAFVPFMANPSPQMNGAQLITFIDVSQNTQSALALAASGALGTVITLTSTLYGPPSNLMQASVVAGSTAGKKLILTDGYANTQIVGDNLGVPFQLAYVGSATGGVNYTVTSGSFILHSPTAGESVNIPLGSGGYLLTSQLIQAINGTGYYIAQGLSATNGQLPAQDLSPVVSGSLTVPVSGEPQYSNVWAYKNDIPFWVNQFGSAFATAAVSGSAADVAGWLPVNIPATFFAGATGVPPVTQDYADGFNVALAVPGWTVFADSNSSAVRALGAQHAQTASTTPYGMWRRFFTGSELGDSVATTQANAIIADAKETNYLYPGIYRVNTASGNNELYSGLYAAAAAAAMATGNIVAEPLTNKVLNATGVEVLLTTSEQIALQNAGVMTIVRDPNTNVTKILSDVTTWQVDANVENTSSQQIACRFWLAYSVVNALRPYVGTIASQVTEVNIVRALVRCLNSLLYTGGSSNGVLADWDRDSLSLVFNGTNMVAAIQFNATLVSQNRYITIYVPIQPLNLTITASAVAA